MAGDTPALHRSDKPNKRRSRKDSPNRRGSSAVDCRLPRSDSGRLIRSIAILTSSGTAASAPTETSAIAVACREWAARSFRHEHSDPEANGGAGQGRANRPAESAPRFLEWISRVTSPTLILLVSKKETGISQPRDRVSAHVSHHPSMSNPIYALILAGGSGERFWPLSRRARPKQLLRLVADKTLLEETVARLDGLGAATNAS